MTQTKLAKKAIENQQREIDDGIIMHIQEQV